jgi:hypothetical protein
MQLSQRETVSWSHWLKENVITYPAGLLASLWGCWGVGFCCCWCWPLMTTDSQLLSVVVAEACVESTK